MHAAIYRARMTEDTFQILLDVMDRHFAALSLPDPSTDPKIVRAISFSELPSTRRILIEQSYQADDSGTLVRQYSCEQIFDKLSNSREVKVSEVVRTGSERCLSNTWRTTLPVFGKLGNAGWHNGHFGQMIKGVEPQISQKMEAMEVEEINVKPFVKKVVDQSSKILPIFELNGMSLSDADSYDRTLTKAKTVASFEARGGRGFAKSAVRSRSVSPKKSTNRAIISESKLTDILKLQDTDQASKTDYGTVKKNLRSLVPEKTINSKKSRFSCTWYKFIFFLLLSLSAAIIAIFLHDDNSSMYQVDSLDIANMTMELNLKVYGQERAINELIQELEKSSTGINLIVLIGGTGVGKSYSIGIVAKHFTPSSNVFEYFSPLQKFIRKALGALSYNRCNLVILENLRKNDIRDVVLFMELLKEQQDPLCVRTIAIFNPQEMGTDLVRTFDIEESVGEIVSVFRDKQRHDTKIIAFDVLDDSSIEGCILQVARDKNVNLSPEKLMEIRDGLITTGSGCKGAYAKVQMFTDS